MRTQLKPECEKGRLAWPVFLRSCVVLMDVIDRELREVAGLQLTWFDVLAQLARDPEGKMPMKRLADSVLLSKSGVTRLVDRMEKDGLIKRDSCTSDGRVVYAALTSKGEAAFRKAAPVAFKGIEEHFARHLSQAEAEALAASLTRVLEVEDQWWLCGRFKQQPQH